MMDVLSHNQAHFRVRSENNVTQVVADALSPYPERPISGQAAEWNI